METRWSVLISAAMHSELCLQNEPPIPQDASGRLLRPGCNWRCFLCWQHPPRPVTPLSRFSAGPSLTRGASSAASPCSGSTAIKEGLWTEGQITDGVNGVGSAEGHVHREATVTWNSSHFPVLAICQAFRRVSLVHYVVSARNTPPI